MFRLGIFGAVAFCTFAFAALSSGAQKQLPSQGTAIPEVHTYGLGGEKVYDRITNTERQIRNIMGMPLYETQAQRSAYGRLFWALAGTKALVEKYENKVPQLEQALSQPITGRADAPTWPGQSQVQIWRLNRADTGRYLNAFRHLYPDHFSTVVAHGGAVDFMAVHPPVPTDQADRWPWPGTLVPAVVTSGLREGESMGYLIFGPLSASNDLLELRARAFVHRAKNRPFHALYDDHCTRALANNAYSPDQTRQALDAEIQNLEENLLKDATCGDIRSRFFQTFKAIAQTRSIRTFLESLRTFETRTEPAIFDDLLQHWANAVACSVAATVDEQIVFQGPMPNAISRQLALSAGTPRANNNQIEVPIFLKIGNRTIESPRLKYRIANSPNSTWQETQNGQVMLPRHEDGATLEFQCPPILGAWVPIPPLKLRVALMIRETVNEQPSDAAIFARLLDTTLSKAGFSVRSVASESEVTSKDFDAFIRGNAHTWQAYPNTPKMYKARVELEVGRPGIPDTYPFESQKRSYNEVDAHTARRASLQKALDPLKEKLIQQLRSF